MGFIRPPAHQASNIGALKAAEGRPVLIGGCLIAAVMALLFLACPDFLTFLDHLHYDELLRRFPDNAASDRVVIVDIDEKSLERYGQWPWPRYRVASLFERIADLSPAAVGIDIIFPEPDRTSAGRVLKELGDDHGLELQVGGLPPGVMDNDAALGESLESGPFVLCNKFHFNPREKSSDRCALHPVRTAVMGRGEAPSGILSGIPEGLGVLCNLPELGGRVDTDGFFNFSPDADGMLRRLPLLIRHNGEIHASLGLAAVLKARQKPVLVLKSSGPALASINLGALSIPVDARGQLLIKFRGPSRSYDTLSAADILDGTVPRHRLQDRIAFVGTSATGLKDVLTTPFDPIFPGVEVHAAVADNLMTGDFIRKSPGAGVMTMVLMLGSGAMLSWVIARQSAIQGFGVMCLLGAGIWITLQQVFYRKGLFLGPAFPMASLLVIYVVAGAIKFRLAEKRQIQQMKALVLTQDIAIESMANLSECRDPETGGHIKRTRRYVRLLAEQLKHHERYRHFLTDAAIDLLYKSAPLHDIGKVGIPDAILLKAERLTEAEFEIMKTHTILGRDVIAASARKLGKASFLDIAAEMAYSHQERWDGSGYPLGLRGEAIPVSGRLMALADVYDALISQRTYKPPFPHAMAVEIIKAGRSSHFDPCVVDAFLEVQDRFKSVARKYADSPEEKQALERDAPSLMPMAWREKT